MHSERRINHFLNTANKQNINTLCFKTQQSEFFFTWSICLYVMEFCLVLFFMLCSSAWSAGRAQKVGGAWRCNMLMMV